jgi:methylase of polypeptide subunit release factors
MPSPPPPPSDDAFHPTEYAAALMQQLRQLAPRLCLDEVLELGTGSGVVLAQLLELGAKHAVGVDIEAAAVQCTLRLLDELGHASPRVELLQGDLWAPCTGRRFDLVVTNLPQFPAQAPLPDGRLPTWSLGGADGRAQIDRFLDGLPLHLKPGGMALMTHNAFVDLERTQQRLHVLGLQGAVACTVNVPLPVAKLQGLDAELLSRCLGRGLQRIGGYGFAEFHVLEIAHA